jgi:hypothetical protein
MYLRKDLIAFFPEQKISMILFSVVKITDLTFTKALLLENLRYSLHSSRHE